MRVIQKKRLQVPWRVQGIFFFSKVGIPACRGGPNGQNKPGTASVSCEMSSQQASSSTSAEAVCSTYRQCKIRSVIKFLTLRHESAAEIHRQLVETYGPEVMSRQHVYKWVRSFKGGRTDTHDEERSWRLSLVSEELLQQVDENICDD
ncbi:GVQW3 protein, partial [Polypterus senegalus]